MATGRPTGATRQAARMVLSANVNSAGRRLLLEMAPQAKIGVAGDKHLLVDGTVNGVAGGAAFPHGLVLKYEGPALGGMALTARLRFSSERCAPAFDGLTFVGTVAIGARDFTLRDGMMIGEVELAAFIEVTGETDFGGFLRIDDGMTGAARLVMDAAGAVAGFATHLGSVLTFGLEARMNGAWEILRDIGMTFLAAFGAYKGRARDVRGDHDGAVNCGAGDNDRGGQKTG